MTTQTNNNLEQEMKTYFQFSLINKIMEQNPQDYEKIIKYKKEQNPEQFSEWMKELREHQHFCAIWKIMKKDII